MKRTHYPKGKKQRKKDCPWLICWVDAGHQLEQSWYTGTDRDDLRAFADLVLQTVGWCIDRTKHCVMFAARRAPTVGGGWNYGNIMSIPKGCILSMRRLK
jgi:hypothetical protein